MQTIRLLVFILALSFLSVSTSFAIDNTDNTTKPTPKKSMSNIKASVKPAKDWYPSGAPLSGKGELWEQGESIQELARKRTPAKPIVVPTNKPNTNESKDSQVKSIADYERNLDNKPIAIGKTKIHSDSSVEGEATWRPSFTEPVKIDETVLNSQREVVGAYATMVEEDNFTVSAGPELHLQEHLDSPLDSDGPSQNSEVGMGMKFKWGF